MWELGFCEGWFGQSNRFIRYPISVWWRLKWKEILLNRWTALMKDCKKVVSTSSRTCNKWISIHPWTLCCQSYKRVVTVFTAYLRGLQNYHNRFNCSWRSIKLFWCLFMKFHFPNPVTLMAHIGVVKRFVGIIGCATPMILNLRK